MKVWCGLRAVDDLYALHRHPLVFAVVLLLAFVMCVEVGKTALDDSGKTALMVVVLWL